MGVTANVKVAPPANIEGEKGQDGNKEAEKGFSREVSNENTRWNSKDKAVASIVAQH